MHKVSDVKINNVSGLVSLIGIIGDDDLATEAPGECLVSLRFVDVTLAAMLRFDPNIQAGFTRPGMILPRLAMNPPSAFCASWIQTGTVTSWLEFIAGNMSPAEGDEESAGQEELSEIVQAVSGFIAGAFPRYFADFAEKVLGLPAVLARQYRALADVLDEERAARAGNHGPREAAPEPALVDRLRAASMRADTDEEYDALHAEGGEDEVVPPDDDYSIDYGPGGPDDDSPPDTHPGGALLTDVPPAAPTQDNTTETP